MFPCKKCKTAFRGVHYAARNGHYKCLSILVKSNRQDVNFGDCYGETPLTRAAEHGDYLCVALLIGAGADVNHLSANSNTPLLAAVERCSVRCVLVLIVGGAQVNGTIDEDDMGWDSDDTELEERPLIKAAECAQYTIMEVLMKAGADVNAVNMCGRTVLMECAASAEHRGVELLLEADADVNEIDRWGSTALMCAAEARFGKKLTCLQLLLWAGAHVNLRTSNMLRVNALQRCLQSQKGPDPEKCQLLLLAAGESIDEENKRKILGNDLRKEDGFSLKHLCRERIRKLLLDIDPHENLFVRIPKLDVPSIVEEYLLYYASLDEEEPEADTDWSDYEPASGSEYDSDPNDDYEKYFTYTLGSDCEDEDCQEHGFESENNSSCSDDADSGDEGDGQSSLSGTDDDDDDDKGDGQSSASSTDDDDGDDKGDGQSSVSGTDDDDEGDGQSSMSGADGEGDGQSSVSGTDDDDDKGDGQSSMSGADDGDGQSSVSGTDDDDDGDDKGDGQSSVSGTDDDGDDKGDGQSSVSGTDDDHHHGSDEPSKTGKRIGAGQ